MTSSYDEDNLILLQGRPAINVKGLQRKSSYEEEELKREKDIEEVRRALLMNPNNQIGLSSKTSSISFDKPLQHIDRNSKITVPALPDAIKKSQDKPSAISSDVLSGGTGSNEDAPNPSKKRKNDQMAGADRLSPGQKKKSKANTSSKGQLSSYVENVISNDISRNSGPEPSSMKENSHKKKIITDFFKPTSPEKNSKNKSIGNTSRSKPKLVIAQKNFLDTNEGSESRKEEQERDRKSVHVKITEYENRIKDSEREKEKREKFWEEKFEKFDKNFRIYKEKVMKFVAKHVLELESFKRSDRKNYLNQQKQRLGEYIQQREGNKFVEVWLDGAEFRNIKQKINEIVSEREELEKVKKSAAKFPKKSLGRSSLPVDSSDSNTTEEQEKERINARIMMLNANENDLRNKVEKLEAEKLEYYYQYKRQYEEDHSRYGRPNPETNSPMWPIFNEKYQILALLGKGGFSEVYKAHDLEELRDVACKIHQLNPNWSESAKQNYVKHATRESDVHKNFNHPNIVRLYDSIGIDDNSFATILEFCEGPDLSFYLKQHKILPEKEAKAIIRQILAGLKYINEQDTRIIHYDLKPQNVLFHKGDVKISDFGLCKVLDPDTSRIELTSQGVGTYWYLPPECFSMTDNPIMINNKVDVWSVGVIFYEMLFGARPFGNGMSQEKILKENIMLKAYNVNFPPKPPVSNDAKDFIKRCLMYKQEDRYDVFQCYNASYFKK